MLGKMGSTFRVSNWSTVYENNRTRELKRLEWVPVPNKMDGAGYTELVDHPNGAAHLGAWLAILEIASRQTVRGEIPQASTGVSAALSRISRLPAPLFDEVIPRLEVIGWIERTGDTAIPYQQNQQVAIIPQEGAGIPQASAGMSQRGAGFPALKGMELKGMEGNKTPVAKPATVDDIELWFSGEFWPLYPRHTARKDGLKAARAQLKSAADRAAAMKGLRSQVQELRSREESKIPHPATWINGRRWEDEGPQLFRQSTPQPQGPAYQPWVDKFAHLEVSK